MPENEVTWARVEEVQQRRSEIGQRLLTEQECIALQAAFLRDLNMAPSNLVPPESKDGPPVAPIISVIPVAPSAPPTVDQLVRDANAPTSNDRFKPDLSNPMKITDILTGKEYRILAVGEPEVLDASTAPNHLLKFSQKALRSINIKHEDDFFWGELTPLTRSALKAQEINNLEDFKAKSDRFDKMPSAALGEVIRFLLARK